MAPSGGIVHAGGCQEKREVAQAQGSSLLKTASMIRSRGGESLAGGGKSLWGSDQYLSVGESHMAEQLRCRKWIATSMYKGHPCLHPLLAFPVLPQ